MTLTITKVPDAAAALGLGQFEQLFQIQPGTSDYPSSGYPITAAQLGLGNLYGLWEVSGNVAAAAYALKPILPSASFGASPQPATSLNLEVTSADSQVAPTTNLAACTWFVRVLAAAE